MLSSSLKNDSKFRRSSRVLGSTKGLSESVGSLDASKEIRLINNELQIHTKTAELSSIDFEGSNPEESSVGIPAIAAEGSEDIFVDEGSSGHIPHTTSANPYYKQPTENTQLLSSEDQPQDLESFNALLGHNTHAADYYDFNQYANADNNSVSKASSILNFTKKINRSVSNKFLNINKDNGSSTGYIMDNPVATSGKLDSLKELLTESANLMPCVFLGLLLNILDALSYGMIIFPINKPLFADLGPSGLSMFYISCIVSQLVFSLGGSTFVSAIGSEMIEVTPFFHSMALNIMASIGTDDSFKNKDAIVATTITCYCLSSMLTGLAFFLLGKFKLGQLIGFFPRHILIGCIGGVGYFLVITGLEVTSRMSSSFSYSWANLQFLFGGVTFIKWFSAALITIVLILMQRFSKRLASFSLLLPVYFMGIFAFIHLLIWVVPGWDLQSARDNGFIFDVPTFEANKDVVHTAGSSDSWYHFYTLFKFSKVRWSLILHEIPSMLALTFFGILHVPINVPALAISIQKDDFDVNEELIAHGYSNFISGMVGSIQNYLVYSNSLLFIRSGVGEKRLAGILLAATTAIVMFIGPSLIKFIPVCVVGSLIFLLGYELLKESLVDSYSKLSTFDYCTIIVIILTMGMWDFVYGIVLGILIAFISFVVENANQDPIKKVLTGEFIRLTTNRNHLTNIFLKNVGSQTLIFKLQGNIFFGTIGKVESEIKRRFETNTNEYNFRYVVLDLSSVLSVDYTAAEGFQSIKNFTRRNNSYLIISSINSDGIYDSLLNVGLIDDCDSKDDNSTQLFHDLNSALEWCENEYLISIYNLRSAHNQRRGRVNSTVSSRNPLLNHGSTQRQAPANLAIPVHNSHNNSEDFKYNLTESYLNPMSLINNNNNMGSPRQKNIIKAITKSVNEENSFYNKLANKNGSGELQRTVSLTVKDDLEIAITKLIKTTFKGISHKPSEFWKPLLPFLSETFLEKGSDYFLSSNNSPVESSVEDAHKTPAADPKEFFFIIESGLVQLSYDYSQGKISETLVPKTAFGSLGINSSTLASRTTRNLKISALSDSKIWTLTFENFEKLLEQYNDIANELLLVEINLLSERFDKITSFILISS